MKPSHTRGASFPVFWDECGLLTTEEVLESREDLESSLLGPDGNPLFYRSKKLGYIGFTRLKERS